MSVPQMKWRKLWRRQQFRPEVISQVLISIARRRSCASLKYIGEKKFRAVIGNERALPGNERAITGNERAKFFLEIFNEIANIASFWAE